MPNNKGTLVPSGKTKELYAEIDWDVYTNFHRVRMERGFEHDKDGVQEALREWYEKYNAQLSNPHPFNLVAPKKPGRSIDDLTQAERVDLDDFKKKLKKLLTDYEEMLEHKDDKYWIDKKEAAEKAWKANDYQGIKPSVQKPTFEGILWMRDLLLEKLTKACKYKAFKHLDDPDFTALKNKVEAVLKK